MSKSDSSHFQGIGFSGILGIVFIVLKLCGVVSWSWWAVLSPLWGPVAIVIAFGLGLLLYVTITKLFDEKGKY